MTAPVESDVVADALSRVVNSVHPLKVVLFGSRARGDDRAGSDIDFLVVVPDGSDRSQLYKDGYRSMIGLGTPVDILIVEESFLAARADDRYSVLFPATREGRVMYAA
jgi:predicted nucleotidyltransferase